MSLSACAIRELATSTSGSVYSGVHNSLDAPSVSLRPVSRHVGRYALHFAPDHWIPAPSGVLSGSDTGVSGRLRRWIRDQWPRQSRDPTVTVPAISCSPCNPSRICSLKLFFQHEISARPAPVNARRVPNAQTTPYSAPFPVRAFVRPTAA